MMRLLFFLTLLTATAGCLDAEGFIAESASETCQWYQRCNILDIIGYASQADCASELSAVAEESGKLGEHCLDYDRKAAMQCIEDLQNAGCDDMNQYPESCFNACPASE
jgi:hypothetical protein